MFGKKFSNKLNAMDQLNIEALEMEHQLEHGGPPALSADNGESSDLSLNSITQHHKKHSKSKIKQKAKFKNDDLRQEEAVKYEHVTFPPAKAYLFLCYYARLVQIDPYFNNYILFSIIVAGTLVGIQTYPGMADNIYVSTIDSIVLYSFTVEVLVKIMSEGLSPIYYITGKQWKWNVFDFVVIAVCMPFIPISGNQVAVLRLLRLMRLTKLFKRIPQLQMIIGGLVGGMKSIAYILVLLVLTFYVYAVAGIIFFGTNDPWHFRSVEVTLLTLMSVITFDSWGDIFYTAYDGCEVYGVYTRLYTSDPALDQRVLGGTMYCRTPVDSAANRVGVVLYYFSFCILAGFCILSMFIGAVMMSMLDSMLTLQREKFTKERDRRKSRIESEISRLTNFSKIDRKTKRTVRLIKLVFMGRSIVESKFKPVYFKGRRRKPTTYNRIIGFFEPIYIRVVDLAGTIAESKSFQNFVTLVILIASAEVGLQTDEALSNYLIDYIEYLDIVILIVFTFEVAVKIIAEGATFWLYFESNWNKFDFAIVASSYLPTGNGSMIMMLRLLRLLRVLKLLRAFPKLQVIVSALIKGLSSIFFIGVIIFLWMYFFAIFGQIFFSYNDDWHFGSLHMALLTLIQILTMDNWSNIMHINLYGCYAPVWLYAQNTPYSCPPDAKGNFAAAAIYFTIFVIVGSFVLLSLFIGVVGMSMEEAAHEQKEELRVFEKVHTVMQDFEIDSYTMQLYKEVFNMVDFTKAGKIGKEELKFGLRIAGNDLNHQDFLRIWKKVDLDNSHTIDFSEFLTFVFDLKYQRAPLKLKRKHDFMHHVRKYSMINTSTRAMPVDGIRDSFDAVLEEIPDENDDIGDNADYTGEDDEDFSEILRTIRSQIDRLEKLRGIESPNSTNAPESFPLWSPNNVGHNYNGWMPGSSYPMYHPAPYYSPPYAQYSSPANSGPFTSAQNPYIPYNQSQNPYASPGAMYPGSPVSNTPAANLDPDAVMRHHVQTQLLIPVTNYTTSRPSRNIITNGPSSPGGINENDPVNLPPKRKPCKSLLMSV